MALFTDRATAVQPDFTLTEANAAAVAAICQRLEGLPRPSSWPRRGPGAPARRDAYAVGAARLPLLTGGSRDLPARQRTMRDTIAWSYDLLTPPGGTVSAPLGLRWRVYARGDRSSGRCG